MFAISTTSRRELSSSFFFLQGKAQKEIQAILIETLGEHAPSYATVKNRVAQFKRGDFSTFNAPCPCCRGDLAGRTKYWIFLNGLQKLEQRVKKCIEFRGEYVE